MRTQVERFQVNLKTQPKRFDVKLTRQGFPWRGIAVALALAMPTALTATLFLDGQRITAASLGLDTIAPALGFTASPAPAAASIVLHKAGDGQFYADIAFDGAVISARVDPSAARSTISAHDAGVAIDAGAQLLMTGLAIEGRQIGTTSLAVAGETVIGHDLLDRLGRTEVGDFRLRIAGG